MLAWDKPQPSCKVSSTFEVRHAWCKRLYRQRCYWADPGHCLQSPGGVGFGCQVLDTPRFDIDAFRYLRYLDEKIAALIANEYRQIAVWFIDKHFNPFQMRNALWECVPELV